MRAWSLKRRRINREAKKIRDAYQQEFPRCQFPGLMHWGTDIHEIIKGNRGLFIQYRCCFLNLCRSHHELVESRPAEFPKARQLAWKLHYDPAGYDLDQVNSLHKKLDVSQQDVNHWLMHDFGDGNVQKSSQDPFS